MPAGGEQRAQGALRPLLGQHNGSGAVLYQLFSTMRAAAIQQQQQRHLAHLEHAYGGGGDEPCPIESDDGEELDAQDAHEEDLVWRLHPGHMFGTGIVQGLQPAALQRTALREPISDPDDEDDSCPPLPSVLPGPEPSSWLSAGQSFSGTQRFSASPLRSNNNAHEDWQVALQIQSCDLRRGYLCGVMEACNTPRASKPIVTFFEGEIIDNTNHTFLTNKWGAVQTTDVQHWGKLPGWSPLRPQALRHGGRAAGLAASPYIFMRIKEQFFVDAGADCGLTIAGFYYCCLDRQTGSIKGYYYDAASTPFQFLDLTPHIPGGCSGVAFGSYELAGAAAAAALR